MAKKTDNGAGPFKMPIKIVRLSFDDDGYPGFVCERRTNLPIGITRQLSEAAEDAAEDRYRELLLQVFPSWNFVDTDGIAIPHVLEGFDSIPDDLLVAMFRRGAEALREAVMPVPLGTESSGEVSESELVS